MFSEMTQPAGPQVGQPPGLSSALVTSCRPSPRGWQRISRLEDGGALHGAPCQDEGTCSRLGHLAGPQFPHLRNGISRSSPRAWGERGCDGRPRQCGWRGAHWKLGKRAWTTAAGTLGGTELPPPPPQSHLHRGGEEKNYRRITENERGASPSEVGGRGVDSTSRGRPWPPGWGLAHQGQGQDGGREGGGVTAVLNRILPKAEAGQ